MNSDFIRIKDLDGELKLSHKKNDYGLTVSTKELVIQKPHVNYHIKLRDIVSIMPFRPAPGKPVRIVAEGALRNEVTQMPNAAGQYKFYVTGAVMHNRSGMFQLGAMEFVLPVVSELLQRIAEYGGLGSIPAGSDL
jgi:hypothetical protein